MADLNKLVSEVIMHFTADVLAIATVETLRGWGPVIVQRTRKTIARGLRKLADILDPPTTPPKLGP